MSPRRGAIVLAATLTAAAAVPAAHADRRACASRLSTALASLAAASRDADAVVQAERFAADADHHGYRALARLAHEVEASAQAAEVAAMRHALTTLIRPPPRVAITGACAAPT